VGSRLSFGVIGIRAAQEGNGTPGGDEAAEATHRTGYGVVSYSTVGYASRHAEPHHLNW